MSTTPHPRMHGDPRSSFPRYEWPAGKRCAAVFSLDLDAESPLLWIQRGKPTRHLGEIEQRRYGPRQGVARVLDLLDEFGLSGSFYVPGIVARTYPDLLPLLVARGHEIAHHGDVHERMDAIPIAESEQLLVHSIETFAAQVGRTPRGFRSPSWELTDESIALLRRHGIAYDSSLMGFDHPYEVDGLIEIPVQWMVDDALYFRYTNSPRDKTHPANPAAVLESWIEEFEGVHEWGGLFMITVHDWISGRPQRLRLLHKLIAHIRRHDDVWWCRADELAAWHAQSPNAGRFAVAAQGIDTSF